MAQDGRTDDSTETHPVEEARAGGRSLRAARLAAPVLLLAAIPALVLPVLRGKSLTMDEYVHVPAGSVAIVTGSHRPNCEQPPLPKWLAATAARMAGVVVEEVDSYDRDAVGEAYRRFWFENRWTLDDVLERARLPLVLVGVGLGLLVWLWARRLYGAWGGVASLAAYAFSPTLLAHTGLVTGDLVGAAAYLVALRVGWMACRKATAGRLAALGAAVGLAASSKFSALIVVPAILVFVGWTAMRARLGSERHVLDVHERLPGGGRGVRGAVGAGAIVLAVAAAVIWAGYGFEAAPLAREAKLPRNQALSAMLASNPAALRAYRFVAEDVPFPAPSFFRGLDRVRKHARHGHDAFLDGERSADGWWRYFPMAFWMKTSLPLLLLLAAVAATWWLGRPVDEPGAEALLVCGAVTFFLVAMASGINIGIRHVLPVYPILCVLVGRLATVRLPRAAVAACLGALLGWHGVEAIRTCPDHLAYFQPLAGGPDRGYTRLVDSNLDWGQDLRGLARDLKERGQRRLWLTYFGPIDPAYYGIEHEPLPPGKPVTGFVAISATALQLGIDGRSPRPEHDDPYGWLRAHEPMDSIGHSILIYVIPER